MATPYVGEIRMFAGNFAPVNWAFCDGSLLAISEYEVLYTLIGATYGGNGTTTFALPDLRSRSPIHQGNGYGIGQAGGAETVILTVPQLPGHTHAPQASTAANGTSVNSPAGGVWSSWTGGQYSSQAPTLALHLVAVNNTGGSEPHDNMVPFQVISFIISLFGVYPSQG